MASDTSKQSKDELLERLGKLCVLIVDADIRAAQLTRTVLSTLGITNTHLTRDTDQALSVLNSKSVDVLITEWDTRPMNGLELTKTIRKATEAAYCAMPILMVSGRNSEEEIRTANDSGINEYLVKPFNTRSMLARIFAMVELPRQFVVSSDFVGPDRRRQGNPPDGVSERRGRDAVVVTPPASLHAAPGIPPAEEGKATIVSADYRLKKKLDVAVTSQMAGIDGILARTAQAAAEPDALERIMADIAVMRQALQAIAASTDYTETGIDRICTAAVSVRTRAMTAGYVLGAKVAAHLNDFCRKYYDRANSGHVMVLEKHIETLTAIFVARLVGDGGDIGQELFRELAKLVKKYMIER